jgi:hypothetical protein
MAILEIMLLNCQCQSWLRDWTGRASNHCPRPMLQHAGVQYSHRAIELHCRSSTFWHKVIVVFYAMIGLSSLLTIYSSTQHQKRHLCWNSEFRVSGRRSGHDM